MRDRRVTAYVLLLSIIAGLFFAGNISAKADAEEISYSLGGNADICYKRSENKVYYKRLHYSSNSGIRYYTQYFVISLMPADTTDDLGNLSKKSGEYCKTITVSFSGASVGESESGKNGDFYWYDSARNDEGYVQTTYVMDGSIFENLLLDAGIEGESNIYIHHVFAVAGGSESDDWHKRYNVKNNTPYYKYSDLMKVGWNNTSATHESQMNCLNIPVPFERQTRMITDIPAYVDEMVTMSPTYYEEEIFIITPPVSPTGEEPTSAPTLTPLPFIISIIPQLIPTISLPWQDPEEKPTLTPEPAADTEPVLTPVPIPMPTPIPVTDTVDSIPTPIITATPTPRGDITLNIITDNLKYVQLLDADADNAHIVVGNEVSETLSLSVTNYGDDIRVSFPFDIYNGKGERLYANTWNVINNPYRVPDDTQEGEYTIRSAAVTYAGNFASYAEEKLTVSGKLYGLSLTGINSDAPDWKGVFDSGDYICLSGLNDELGYSKRSDTKRVLPLVDGDSPNNTACGMLKSGYTWTFKLKTYGSALSAEGAHILIVPAFYYITENLNGRQAVKLYGTDVCEIRGSIEARKVQNVGNESIWEFKWGLPDEWFCAAADEDIEGLIERKGGLSFKEEFWKRRGYLAVNFEIGAYDASGKLIMTYANKKTNVDMGMCDMWKTEGCLSSKTDCFGQKFTIDEGDVIILRLPGSTFDSNGNPSPPTSAKEDKTVIYGGFR